MALVTGEISAGEASKTMRAIFARRGARPRLQLAMVFGLAAAFVIAGLTLMWATGMSENYGPLVIGLSLVLSWLVYFVVGRRWAMSNFRKSLTSRDLPTVFPFRTELTAEAMRREFGDVTSIVRWPAVTELFSSNGYWIFMVQASPSFIPRRCFSDPRAERAFISEALGYMSEGARNRSADAVKFAVS